MTERKRFHGPAALVVLCLVLSGCGKAEQGQQGLNPSGDGRQGIDLSRPSPGHLAAPGKAYDGTISGVVSDSMCGKDHMMMGEPGRDAVACTRDCVKKEYKYVLVDSHGDVYNLVNEEKSLDKLNELAGKEVEITGHVDPGLKMIKVQSVKAPAKKKLMPATS